MTLLDDVANRLSETGELNIIATRTVLPGHQKEFEAILKEMVARDPCQRQGLPSL